MKHERDLTRFSRRTFLTAGSLSAFGLTLPQMLMLRSVSAGQAGRAKSCILLFGTGGPSQHDTFDPKPDAGGGIAGEFGDIPTSVPGTRICEHLPMMAREAHRYTIIRSTYHGSNIHGVGVHYNLTGLEPSPLPKGEPQISRKDPPSVGGAIRQLRGDKNGLPGAVHLPVRIGDQNNFQWSGQHAGFLGPKFDPLMLIDEQWRPGSLPSGFNPPEDVGRQRFHQRAGLLHGLESAQRRPVAGEVDYARFRDQAVSIMEEPSVWEAFLIEKERPATIERYGDNKFGRSCLVARRLVEAGVGLVTVPWMYLHSTKNFDTHYNHFKVMKELLLPPLDRAFSALLEDLDDRGMLDETMVAWTGEFGRTPRINKHGGRDHWGNVYSTVLAGGGIAGGQVYGSSDKIGAEPDSRPVHTRDLMATIYHALGYGPGTMVYDVVGRPHPIVQGKPILSLF